jgi:hypothetical protein
VVGRAVGTSYPHGSAFTTVNFRIARHPGIQCLLIR